MKKILLFLLFLILIAAFLLYKPNETNSKIKIAVDIYPLEEFSNAIGGKYVDVINVLPDGASPHGFELSPKSAMAIEDSDMFIYVGGAADPWAKNIQTKGKRISLVDEYEKWSGKHITNPHVWLDIKFDEYVVKRIEQELETKDSSHAEYYRKNANAYIEKLKELDTYANTKLKNVSIRAYITMHPAFYYFNKRYNLSFLGLMEPTAGSDLSGQQMASLITKSKQMGVRYVYAEPQLNPKPINMLASEINATVLTIDPVPSLTKGERAKNETFISIMKKNIDALSEGLR